MGKWDKNIIKFALRAAFLKMSPRDQIRNPVMFTVYVGAVLATALFIQALIAEGEAAPDFIFIIALWLWATLFFANFAFVTCQ